MFTILLAPQYTFCKLSWLLEHKGPDVAFPTFPSLFYLSIHLTLIEVSNTGLFFSLAGHQ
jgi:hypothetical protein